MHKTTHLPPDVAQLAQERGIGEQLEAILELTQEMFPGPIRIETDADPEWPAERYVTFVVEVSGTMKDFVGKQGLWQEQVVERFPDCSDLVGLSFF